MKLSFSTLGNPDWSFDKTLEEAQKLGFEAIEIRGVQGKMEAGDIVEFFPENEASTKAKLKEHNLKICGFGSSITFHDFSRYQEVIKQGKTAIDICQRMNIPFVRVFGDRIPSKDERTAVIKRVVEGIRELCAYAEGKDIEILLEVHGDFNTIENVMEVSKALESCASFGLLWDIEHSHKIYGENFKEFYNKIKPFIKHVHIKDCVKSKENFDLCIVGQGDIPIREIVKALEEDGYSGYMSLEWEKKWHPELQEPEEAYPAYVKFMKSLSF